MKPVKQRNRHNPGAGVWGDCHRAAIASILELELDEVPHFYDNGCDVETAQEHERLFLAGKGIVPITIPLTGELQTLLDWLGAYNPGVCYLLGGLSRTGVTHTVVCRGNEIVHDPSLDESGIIAPAETSGMYWFTFFGSTRGPIPTMEDQMVDRHALFYWVECDSCSARHPDGVDGLMAYSGIEQAHVSASESEWLIEEGRHLCPDCLPVVDSDDGVPTAAEVDT